MQFSVRGGNIEFNGRMMLNCTAWAPSRGSVHARNSYFASNGKFVTSLNKFFVSKYLLVIFLLLFIHSFQVASDFSVNPTNLHIHFEIRYASAFAHVRKKI